MSDRRIIIPPGFTPSGTPSVEVTIAITLVTIVDQRRGKYKPVIGYVGARMIAGTSTLDTNGESADITLPPNSLISPSGTVYEFVVTESGRVTKYYAAIPDESGDLNMSDLLFPSEL